MKPFLACVLMLFASIASAADVKNNVVILLDNSGSMNEQMKTVRQKKMEVAKQALTEAVGQIPDGTNIGLLTFAEWVTPLAVLDRPKLVQGIAQCSANPNVGTPLGTYMKHGVDALLKEREAANGYGTYKLLIVTDGEPTAEPEGLLDQHLKDILGRGIVVECIGVDMAANHSLSTKVYSYMAATDKASLQRSLKKTLAEVPVSQDKAADNSVFEEISGLPTETVSQVISVLSHGQNHPIGERPPTPQTMDPPTDQGQTSVIPPATQSDGNGVAATLLLIFVGGVIVFVGLKILLD